MTTQTDWLGIIMPTQADVSNIDADEWAGILNVETFDGGFDEYGIKRGPISERPNPGTSDVVGRLFLQTDTSPPNLYFDTGTSWESVGGIPDTINADTLDGIDSTGFVRTSPDDFVGIDIVSNGDSIQAAVNAAPTVGGQIYITEDYDPAADTLPITVDRDVEIIGYGAFRGDPIDFTSHSGNYAFDIDRPGTDPYRAPVFRHLGLDGAGYKVTHGTFIRWNSCLVVDAPIDAWQWVGNSETMFDNVCFNCQSHNAGRDGFGVRGLAHNLQLIGCIVRYSQRNGVDLDNAANVTITGGNYEYSGFYNIFASGLDPTIHSVYTEGGAQVDSNPPTFDILLKGDGAEVQHSYFNGLGNVAIGVSLEGINNSVANCTFGGYTSGAIRVHNVGVDCDINGNSHHITDSTQLLASDNGTRTRSNGVIGGAGLGGVDLTATTGQRVGDVAMADGTTTTAYLTARWTGSAWQPSDGGPTI